VCGRGSCEFQHQAAGGERTEIKVAGVKKGKSKKELNCKVYEGWWRGVLLLRGGKMGVRTRYHQNARKKAGSIYEREWGEGSRRESCIGRG